jgi:hypothetical protein
MVDEADKYFVHYKKTNVQVKGLLRCNSVFPSIIRQDRHHVLGIDQIMDLTFLNSQLTRNQIQNHGFPPGWNKCAILTTSDWINLVVINSASIHLELPNRRKKSTGCRRDVPNSVSQSTRQDIGCPLELYLLNTKAGLESPFTAQWTIKYCGEPIVER